MTAHFNLDPVLYLGNEFRNHLIEIAYYAEICRLEDGGILVFINGGDHPGIAYARQMLNLAGNSYAYVEIRSYLQTRKADAKVFRQPVKFF